LKTGEIRYFDSIQANEINNAIVNTTRLYTKKKKKF